MIENSIRAELLRKALVIAFRAKPKRDFQIDFSLKFLEI